MKKNMVIFEVKNENTKDYYEKMINYIKSHYRIIKGGALEKLIMSFEDLLEQKEQLEQEVKDYYIQNVNLRADIMIEKMSIPDKRIKDVSFYELYNMPTYYELTKENQKLKQQFENCYCNRTDCGARIKDSKVYYSLVQKVDNKQKEFADYLKKRQKEVCDVIGTYGTNTDYLYGKKDILDEISEEYRLMTR